MHLANRVYLGVFTSALVSGAILWEGTKYDPYYDIVKVLTVCHGYTGGDIIKGKKYTQKECTAFLEHELGVHQRGMLKCINVPLNQYQHDALLLFTYNVGVNAFCTSNSVAAKLNKGDYQGACNGLLKWSYAKGKYVQGLNNRRVFERKMCMGELNQTVQTNTNYSPDYSSWTSTYYTSTY